MVLQHLLAPRWSLIMWMSFKDLKSKHPDMTNPKLRLWTKMITKGHHDDYNNPPVIPLITGSPAKEMHWLTQLLFLLMHLLFSLHNLLLDP